MSRIIVKNLPKDVTEERLRKHFSDQGTVTDVKLMKTKNGVFRKFAFIGYKDDEESHRAVKYFNKTFIDSSKIVVEIALEYGNEGLDRPWSKYSVGSSANAKATGEEVKKEKKKKREEDEEDGEDPEFLEFLDAHKPKGNRKIWENDEAMQAAADQKIEKKKLKKVLKEDDESSDEEYDEQVVNLKDDNKMEEENIMDKKPTQTAQSDIPMDRHTIVLKGIPFTATESDVKAFLKPLVLKAVRLTLDKKGRPSGKCFVDFNSDADCRRAMKYNKKYMGSRYVEVIRDTGTKAEKQGMTRNQLQKQFVFNTVTEAKSEDLEKVSDTGKLFVRNLSYDCTEDQLKSHFESIGPISSLELPVTKNGKGKGFAYVTFLFPEHSIKATNELTFKPFQGRLIHIIPANKADEDDDGEENESFKKKQKKKQKAKLNNQQSWNTLFLNQNAVSEYLAQKFKMEKADVLDANSEDAAVRLALGETQLLQEIKEFLTSEGVNLDSFSGADIKRSKKIILCKNIPFGTKASELNELFIQHGSIGRLVLPPTGTMAIVEMLDPAEAMKAFKELSYSKFKHLPLYLEWAPENSFNSVFKPADKKVYNNVLEDIENMEHATIFIKNLNFMTTEAEVKEHFSKVGKVTSCTIAKKPDPKTKEGYLSRGYGFVEFATKEMAKDAIKKLNNKMLKDYALELKLSEKQLSKIPDSVKKSRNMEETSAKLLIKNVPFECTKKELTKLFSAFGEIKSMRLPRKQAGSGSHRGFAFIEYTTQSEAREAFEATGDSTHMYGRRLVVEWAKEDATVEEMRIKTAETFVPSVPEKKKKTIEEILKE